VNGSYSLSMTGAVGNYFKHCTFGQDEVAAPTGVGPLGMFTATARNTWEDCVFLVAPSNAGAFWVELGAAGNASWNLWRNCMFLNTSATGMTVGVVFGGGHPATSRLYFDNCWWEGATDFAVDASSFMNMSITTGATTSGKLIVCT